MSDDVKDYTLWVLTAAREELTRADGKASLLLAGAGVGGGALLAAALSGGWSPNRLSNAIEWLWWLGLLAIAAAVGYLGRAVYPRTAAKGYRPTSVGYFGDVDAAPAGTLEALLETSAQADRQGAIDQLKQVSRIVVAKYKDIQMALWLFAGGISGIVLALVINLCLN